jgi:hypothetical protein
MENPIRRNKDLTMWTPPQDELIDEEKPGWTPPTTDVEGVETPSKPESFVRGAAQGASLGFADEITGALEALTSQKPYTQAREESRTAYEAAKEANPKTYMGGEFAGAGATALIPGLGELTVPKIAAQGALYGLGTSEADLTKAAPEDIRQATKDVAIGGASGAIGGTIANKVITPAITKAIPAVAKWATASIIPEKEALEAVTARLSNPEGIKNALTTPGLVEKLGSVTNKALKKANELSEAARGTLNPNKVTNTAELADAFKEIQSNFMTEGIPSGEAQEAALAAINKWKGVVKQHLAANEGDLSDTTLAQLIRDMRKDINYNPQIATAATDSANNALQSLNKRLDSMLKDAPGNEAYKAAMVPVDELMQGITKVEKLFNLVKGKGGEVVASPITESRVAHALGPNKTYTQEALGHLKNLTGEDLMGEMEKSQMRNVFESGKKGGYGLQAWGAGVGATAGRLLQLPGGALAGGAIGGLAANAVEGGKIAATLIDKYLAVKGSGVGGAIMKYGPLLADAAKRGGNALAATHFVLSTSHPEYQKLVEETEENK